MTDSPMDKDLEVSETSDTDYVDYDEGLQNVIKMLPPDPLDLECQRLQQELQELAERKQELEKPNRDMLALLERQANEIEKLELKFSTVTDSLQKDRMSRCQQHRNKVAELDRRHVEMEMEYETRKHELQVLTEARQLNNKKAKKYYEDKKAKAMVDDRKLLNTIEARWKEEYDDRCRELVSVRGELTSLERDRTHLENKVRTQNKIIEKLEAEGREAMELKSTHEKLLDTINEKEMVRERENANLACLKEQLAKMQQELSEVKIKSNQAREEDARLGTLLELLRLKVADNEMELMAHKEQCQMYQDAMPNNEHMRALLQAQLAEQRRRRKELCRVASIKMAREMGDSLRSLYKKLFPQSKEGVASDMPSKMSFDVMSDTMMPPLAMKPQSSSYFGEKMRKNMKMFTSKLQGNAAGSQPSETSTDVRPPPKVAEEPGKSRK